MSSGSEDASAANEGANDAVPGRSGGGLAKGLFWSILFMIGSIGGLTALLVAFIVKSARTPTLELDDVPA